MKRTHRLRRVVASVTLGVGAVAGAVGLTAGTAGAATLTTASVSATSTTIAYVGTNQSAGTVTVTLPAGTLTGTKTLHVAVANTPTGGTVDFSSAPTVVGTNIHATLTTAAYPATAITITVTGKSAPVAATVKISGIKYTTTATPGVSKDVKVTPTITGVTFTPTSVTNAAYPPPVAAVPASMLLTNLTSRPVPPVGVGATGAPAGSWLLTLSGTSSEGVGKGSYVTISIAPHTGVNNCTGTNAVAFAATPAVALTAKTTHNVSATPKFTVSLHGTGTGCSTKFAPNRLKITFTNTVSFTTATGGFIYIMITTVKYSTAFKTVSGTVTVKDVYYRFTGATLANTITGTAKDAALTITSTNAVVSDAYLTANTPAVTMPSNAYDHAISPIKVVESVAGSVPVGYVCVSIADSTRPTAPGWKNTTTLNPAAKGPNFFNTTSKGTLKVTGGNGAAATLHFVGASGSTASVIAFKVTAKSTSASTYVISGLSVNSDNTGIPPLVTARYAATATCATVAGNAPTDNVAVAYTTTPVTTQIYGATADATAAAELQAAFKGTGNFSSCPGLAPTNFTLRSTGQRPVVLARDNGFPDALASQYLAQYLNTGTLLTPQTMLSTVTLAAIRHEGITHVYVVGGPLAVSTAVVNQLQTTPVYHCGGRNLQTTATGAPIYIQVTRIYGATQYDTAQQIAQYVPTTQVHSFNLAGAYAGTNATKGNGMYNQTAGMASTAPKVTGVQRTAILATGTTFQDAEAASALSYSESLPILLTTPTGLSAQARSAIQTLNISQVIVMGGPLAVSNTVVKALQAMTVSVLRVAGKTYSETAVQLADLEVNTTTGHLGLDWELGRCFSPTCKGPSFLGVARGTFFSDGIAGAVIEHYYNRLNTPDRQAGVPLVLTQSPTQVGAALTAFLKTAGTTGINGTPTETVRYLVVLGGPLAVTPAVVNQMVNDIRG